MQKFGHRMVGGGQIRYTGNGIQHCASGVSLQPILDIQE
jgi:hypothetical protein